jgi:formamidopyrimidine-DNA glycosylase
MRGDLRWPLPEGLAEILTGQICGMPWRRGKYILLAFVWTADLTYSSWDVWCYPYL